MKAQIDHMENMINFEGSAEPETISISVPEDFYSKDLPERIEYIANELRVQEARYPASRDKLMRHTSLVRIEEGRFIYAIEYIPLVDNEY